MQCSKIPLIARFFIILAMVVLFLPAPAAYSAGDAEAALFYAEIQKKIDTDANEEEPVSLLDFSRMHSGQLAKPYIPALPSGESVTLEKIHTHGITLSILAFLILLVLIALSFRLRSPYAKKVIFTATAIAVGFPPVFLIASAMYIGSSSEFFGPVDWHADFQIYACGEELPPPFLNSLFSNKTGNALLHEHQDRRMHVQGILASKSDASWRAFIRAEGGDVTSDSFRVPVLDGFREFADGDLCADGKPAEWNAFVYKVNPETNTIWKEKLNTFDTYVPSPYKETPPGDCLILEFAPRHDDTEHICAPHKAAIERGELIPLWIR